MRTRDRLHRHPVVRRHLLTAGKMLHAAARTSVGIEGMAEDQPLDLLRRRARDSTPAKQRFGARYDAGNVVVWNNAAVVCSATLSDPGDPCTPRRIAVKERERPPAWRSCRASTALR